MDLGLFMESSFGIFNTNVPRKRYPRANESPFMTKELHISTIKGINISVQVLKDGTIIKFSKTSARNHSGKPKDRTLTV